MGVFHWHLFVLLYVHISVVNITCLLVVISILYIINVIFATAVFYDLVWPLALHRGRHWFIPQITTTVILKPHQPNIIFQLGVICKYRILPCLLQSDKSWSKDWINALPPAVEVLPGLASCIQLVENRVSVKWLRKWFLITGLHPRTTFRYTSCCSYIMIRSLSPPTASD